MVALPNSDDVGPVDWVCDCDDDRLDVWLTVDVGVDDRHSVTVVVLVTERTVVRDTVGVRDTVAEGVVERDAV